MTSANNSPNFHKIVTSKNLFSKSFERNWVKGKRNWVFLRKIAVTNIEATMVL